MIPALAPVTFALFAAVSTLDAGEPARPLPGGLGAPPEVCEEKGVRVRCPSISRPSALQPPQGTPQGTPEKPATEKPDAKKKVGAGEHVRRYVDEHAPRLADWLFDSDTATDYRGEPLRNRGLRSLPPVAGSHRHSTNVTVLEDIGIVIAGADPRMVYIVSLVAGASGAPLDVRPNDVILALNGQTIDTPLTFRSRYGRLRHGQPVEMVLRRGEQRVTVTFYKPASDRLHDQRVPNVDRPGTILPD